MRLRKFRVNAFRCIRDSGEIKVGDLAAFIGRNESGKTTILQALILLNKDEQVSELDLCDEMTEELKSEINIVEGEFELTNKETNLIKEKFPGVPEITKVRIFKTNKNPKIQYDFGATKISIDENKALNSWENFSENVRNFLDTIPNHIQLKLDMKFFDGPPPKTQQDFNAEMAEFNNNLHVFAAQEKQVMEEWEKIYNDKDSKFDNLLIGTTERTALENFIEENLHPRFVYFSDYKKIIGSVNLNEYLKKSIGISESIEYLEEFDKAETVTNLFYLAELDIEKLPGVRRRRGGEGDRLN